MRRWSHMVRWLGFVGCVAVLLPVGTVAADNGGAPETQDRSPAAVLVTPGEELLLSVNQTAGTVSLVDLTQTPPRIVQELAVGTEPRAAAWVTPGETALVAVAKSDELILLELRGQRLTIQRRWEVGCDPRAIAVAPDRGTAYVALAADDAVAVVDLTATAKVDKIAVGRWPRSLALSADGARLAVGCSGSGGVWVVDCAGRVVLLDRSFNGLNIGQMALAPDGKGVMFPWTFYGQRETSPGSIRQGWVMASRFGYVPFEEEPRPRGMSLDPRRNAVADGHGLVLTADGKQAVLTLGGTQELAVFAVEGLPWTTIGGSDHMDEKLAADRERFARIPLGGRPLGLQLSADGQRAFVANYLKNAVQVVSLTERKVLHEIPLGSRRESPARRGEAVFYDAHRCLENWYSCHTCHFEGGPNSETIDTFNDGSVGTYKTVPGLYQITETGPWTWHGQHTDLRELVSKSFTTTMRGTEPTREELTDLLAYFKSLPAPRKPAATKAASLSSTVSRGKTIFNSDKFRCAECHAGVHFTDGDNHDVKLSRTIDKRREFNTPSLTGVGQRVRYLHDGRTRSLEELLLGPHSPAKIFEGPELSPSERQDLIKYLRSL